MSEHSDIHAQKTQQEHSRAGFFYALGAFVMWGFLALYWKATSHINAVEVTAHRVIWSLPVAALVLFVMGRTGDILPTFKSPGRLFVLFLTSMMISVNWGIFIWAIAEERTLEAAMAYYINPLVSVAMGAIFLRERFDKLQMLAVMLACLAVLMLTILQGVLPWISLTLALTFALYGLLRKTVDVGPAQGFLIEVVLIYPLAILYITFSLLGGNLAFGSTGAGDMGLLILAGPATAIPLILYANGAKRLRLSTIGMMQYIAPTIIFLISIFVFGETLKPPQVIAFIAIWAALALYSWSLTRLGKAQKK